MAEAALRAMSIEEFLGWEDGTDTRYELIRGFPVAMAPPSGPHGDLAARLAGYLEPALRSRRPCRARADAGILHPERADTFFVADLGVTCAPYDRASCTADPILLVEILSPSTERHDRRVKIRAYQRIPSVQEILVLDSGARYAALYRRQGDQWIIQISRAEHDKIALASVGVEISIADIYEGLILDEDDAA